MEYKLKRPVIVEEGSKLKHLLFAELESFGIVIYATNIYFHYCNLSFHWSYVGIYFEDFTLFNRHNSI